VLHRRYAIPSRGIVPPWDRTRQVTLEKDDVNAGQWVPRLHQKLVDPKSAGEQCRIHICRKLQANVSRPQSLECPMPVSKSFKQQKDARRGRLVPFLSEQPRNITNITAFPLPSPSGQCQIKPHQKSVPGAPLTASFSMSLVIHPP